MSSPPPSRLSFLDLSRPGTLRFACTGATVMVLAHLAIWRWIAWRRHQPFAQLLTFWDAQHYSTIARSGYRGPLFAFYPAYPYSLRALAALLGGVTGLEVLGAVFSTLLFLGFVVLCARLAVRAPLPVGLVPRTRLGWLFFLLSPASYIFHSHHTESLFLLLSFGAFAFSGTQRPVRGGLLGALSALTRNQGVFVIATGALLAAWVEPAGRRLRALLAVGVLGALGVLAFLAFENSVGGNPFAFMVAARTYWSHASTVGEMLGTLAFANPWQSTNPPNLIRYAAWWIFFLGAVVLLRRQPPLGLFAVLCLGVQLSQGELVNTFRYIAPVFPLLFFLGDACARWPRWVQVLVLLLLLAVNVDTTRAYGLNEWAY